MRAQASIRRGMSVAALVAVVVLVWSVGCSSQGSAGPAVDGGAATTSATGTTTRSTATSMSAPPSTAAAASTTSSTTPLSRAEEIVGEMTLRDKAAQVLLLAFEGTTLTPSLQNLLLESPPGGFLLLSRNVSGAEQLRSLCGALQEATADGGAPVGLLIAVDQEGGPVQRIHSGLPRIPAARVLGDGASVVEARRLAAETAQGLLSLGVNMNLAPVADVVSDPGSFMHERSYSGDPTVVSDFVEAVTGAFVENGLIAAVKHFPGHGSAAGDTHSQVVVSDASEYELATTHLPPFRAALAAGAECVMMAHIVAMAYDPLDPASLSQTVIEDVLRAGLGFSGVVVADDLEMAAAATPPAEGAGQGPGGDPGELAVRALEAGCDLLISSGVLARQTAMRDAIVAAVEAGKLDEDRLDEAVVRMVELKLRHGLVTSQSAP